MRLIRNLSVVALALLLASPVEAAGKGKKKKTQNGPTIGVVVDVKKDGDKDAGTVTVVSFASAGKNGLQPGEQRTFKVSEATKFETVSGKKKNRTTSPGKFADLVRGETVIVTATGDSASEVKIQPVGKKKKKNK